MANNMPIITKYAGFTVPNFRDKLKMAGPTGKLSTVLTTDDFLKSGIKAKVVTAATFSDTTSIDVDITDAESNAVMVDYNTITYTEGVATTDVTLDFSAIDSAHVQYSNMTFENGLVYPVVDDGFYNYYGGSYSSGNKTNQDDLVGWTITDDNTVTSVTVTTPAVTTFGDPNVDNALVVDVNNPTANEYVDRVLSDRFIIINYYDTIKLSFDYDINIAAGTFSVWFKLVDYRNNDDASFEYWSSSEFNATGNGTIDVEVPSNAFNKYIQFEVYVKGTGVGNVTVNVQGIRFYNANNNRTVKLYTLKPNTFFKSSGPTAALDFSSIDLDTYGLNKLTIEDGVNAVKSYYVLVSKDMSDWYYYSNKEGKWLLAYPGNEVNEVTMTAADLSNLGMEELEFLVKNNSESKLYFWFIPIEESEPSGLVISSVRATFLERTTYTYGAAATGLDCVITPKRKVTITNNTGSDISNFVATVFYI